MIVIDGSGLILGRAATYVAKSIINGEEVRVVNCENFMITGSPLSILANYRQRRKLQHKGTPEKSPAWPKTPNLLVRRIIRGMLPWKSARGRAAFKRLRVQVANPDNLKGVTLEQAKPKSITKHITINALCVELAYVK